MRSLSTLFGVFLLVFSLAPATAQSEGSEASPSKEDMSYALGLNFGRSMKAQDLDVDVEQIVQGIRDGYSGAEARLTDEEMKSVLESFRAQMAADHQEKMTKMGEENQKAGAAFQAANKEKDGVVTLPSGLQYEVLTEGTGPSPGPGDRVTVHYEGKLIDGTVFDSSIQRGKPATFEVDKVIPGWTEALQLMKVGSKWQLVVPPELAYGPRGAGGRIGPNATLVFEVELLGIEDQAAAPAGH